MPPKIAIRDVGKVYETADGFIQALEHVDAALSDGDTAGFQLVAHVHHVSVAGGVKMAQSRHGNPRLGAWIG